MRTRRMPALSDSESDTEDFTASASADRLDSQTEEVDIRRIRRTAQTLSPRPKSSQLLCFAALFVVLLGAALALLTVVLNVGIIAVGALNPAWQTFRALEARSPYSTDDDDDDDGEYHPMALYLRNWTSYWVVVAALFSLESLFVRPTIGTVIPSPLYPGLIFSFLVYLTNNNAEKSGVLYVDVARPAFLRVEGTVERSVQTVLKHVEYVTGLALVYFHDAVEPYTLQLRHAAAMSARQLQAQAQEPPRQTRRRAWGRR